MKATTRYLALLGLGLTTLAVARPEQDWRDHGRDEAAQPHGGQAAPPAQAAPAAPAPRSAPPQPPRGNFGAPQPRGNFGTPQGNGPGNGLANKPGNGAGNGGGNWRSDNRGNWQNGGRGNDGRGDDTRGNDARGNWQNGGSGNDRRSIDGGNRNNYSSNSNGWRNDNPRNDNPRNDNPRNDNPRNDGWRNDGGRHDYNHDGDRDGRRYSWGAERGRQFYDRGRYDAFRDHNFRFDGGRYYGRTRYHLGAFYWPRGYGARVWFVGEWLPSAYFYNDSYFLGGYSSYGLYPPPYGCRWIRVGDDALLIDEFSGEILDAVYNLFW